MGLNTSPATGMLRAIRGQKPRSRREPWRRRSRRCGARSPDCPCARAAGLGLYDWQLEVMGAVSELALWHEDPVVAGRVDQVRSEVARLDTDGIFSLYRHDSEISRLNRDEKLDNPSWSRDQLGAGRRFSELSGGNTDISVQPLRSFMRPIFGPAPASQPTLTLPRGSWRNGWSIIATYRYWPAPNNPWASGDGRHAEFRSLGFYRRPHRRHAGRAGIHTCLRRSRRDRTDRRPSGQWRKP